MKKNVFFILILHFLGCLQYTSIHCSMRLSKTQNLVDSIASFSVSSPLVSTFSQFHRLNLNTGCPRLLLSSTLNKGELGLLLVASNPRTIPVKSMSISFFNQMISLAHPPKFSKIQFYFDSIGCKNRPTHSHQNFPVLGLSYV